MIFLPLSLLFVKRAMTCASDDHQNGFSYEERDVKEISLGEESESDSPELGANIVSIEGVTASAEGLSLRNHKKNGQAEELIINQVEEERGRGSKGDEGILSMLLSHRDLISPALVLLVYNVTPTAAAQLGNYQFSLFQDNSCFLVYLQLTSAISIGLGSLLYPIILSSHLSLPKVIMLAGCLNLTASLLYLPLTTQTRVGTCVGLGFACVPAKMYFSIVSVIGGLFSSWALVPLLVLATNKAPDGRRKGLFYSLYLAALDLGNSIGDWCTTPIVRALNISASNFGHSVTSGMSLLIIICAVARLVSLVVIYVILRNGARAQIRPLTERS